MNSRDANQRRNKSKSPLETSGKPAMCNGGNARSKAKGKQANSCQKCNSNSHETAHCHKRVPKAKKTAGDRSWTPKQCPPQERRARIEADELQVAQDVIAEQREEIEELRNHASSSRPQRRRTVVIAAAPPPPPPFDPSRTITIHLGDEPTDHAWTLEAARVPLPDDILELEEDPRDDEWTHLAAAIPLPEDPIEEDPEEGPPLPPDGVLDDNAQVYFNHQFKIQHKVEAAKQPHYVAFGAAAGLLAAFVKPITITETFISKACSWTVTTAVRNPFKLPLEKVAAYVLKMSNRLSWTLPLGMLAGAAWWYYRQHIKPLMVTYTYSRPHAQTLADVRHDALDSGKLKHADPKLAWMTVKGPRSDIPLISMEEEMLVSTEMFNQLVIPANFDMATEDKLAAERLRYAAKTMHSVNLDSKLMYQTGQYVHQNTTQLAYAAYRQMVDRKERHHFPETQRGFAGVWSHMVTVLAKCNSLVLGLLQNTLPVVGCVSLICLVVCRYKSILDVALRGQPFLTWIQ